MSIDVNRLQKTIFDLEDRAKRVAVVYPIVAGLCFFVLSWVCVAGTARYLDRALFVFLGVIFGRKFGTATKTVLEERKATLEAYLELQDNINKLAKETEALLVKPEQKVPETMPTVVNEAVVKVEIPAEPKLPEIPSVAAPPEVKEALKAVKAKGKPTKLPPKRKAKSVPPAQA